MLGNRGKKEIWPYDGAENETIAKMLDGRELNVPDEICV